MAERRMFARSVVVTGKFARLPAGAQALYFALNMAADDDGFAEAGLVLRMMEGAEADLWTLEQAGYVKVYGDTLVTYIVDWEVHNQIRKSRYREGQYKYLLEEEAVPAPPRRPLGADGGQREGR